MILTKEEKIMKYKEIIQDQKKKNAIFADLRIDMQSLIELGTQIFNNNAVNSPDFEEARNTLLDICDEVCIGIQRFKEIIPAKKVEGEIS